MSSQRDPRGFFFFFIHVKNLFLPKPVSLLCSCILRHLPREVRIKMGLVALSLTEPVGDLSRRGGTGTGRSVMAKAFPSQTLRLPDRVLSD